MKVIQIFVTNLFQNGQIPFFQLSHSSLIPLSTLFILPIPNYKLPKAICNAIISDRQVLAPSPPLVQLWFDFAKWKQVSEATWLLSVFQCELRARPDVTFYWRNRYRYNIAELYLTLCRKSSSSLRNIKAKGGPWPLESNTSSIFSSPNNRGGNRFPCDRDIYIYIAWIVSPGKNLFVAIWPATAAKGSSFIGRDERDELFGKFLRFS